MLEVKDDTVAELLLDKADLLSKKIENNRLLAYMEVYKLKEDAQKYCTHSKRRVHQAGNYHRGEYWKEEICIVCNKNLGELMSES